MNEKTRQLVLDLLTKAHEGALRSVRERLEGLSPEDRDTAQRFLGEFSACLLQGLEGRLLPAEVMDRLASLIHGHPDPDVAGVMRDYAEAVQLLLVESRDGLRGTKRAQGH